MDHRGRIVGMLGLPLTTQRVVVMWQRWRTPVRCVFGAGNSLNAAAERGGQPRGASKPRPLFAFSNNGRAEFWLGASRASGTSPRRLPGSGCVVVRALGHAPLHGRKWPF